MRGRRGRKEAFCGPGTPPPLWGRRAPVLGAGGDAGGGGQAVSSGAEPLALLAAQPNTAFVTLED